MADEAPIDSITALRALLDPSRLAVAGALVGGDRATDELVAATGQDRRATLEALGALRSAGLVMVVDSRYRLDVDTLERVAAATAEVDAVDPAIVAGASPDDQAVLERFFRGRRLTEVPTHHGKRRIVLERIVQEFEVGTHFPEASINSTLREFHPDVATLRRYLVDEDLLDRDNGVYWRSGGPVDH